MVGRDMFSYTKRESFFFYVPVNTFDRDSHKSPRTLVVDNTETVGDNNMIEDNTLEGRHYNIPENHFQNRDSGYCNNSKKRD
jgi:hypothetical protein